MAGAEITYKWISGNTYEVSLTLYRDCQGVAAPTFDFVSIKSTSCNYTLSLRVDPIPGTGQEIPIACPGTTTCSGGTNPGIQKYEYKGTIVLPAQCTDWNFSYRLCCRNCQITTLQYPSCATVPYMYVESTLNNVAAPTNSSPTFTNLPVAFICVNQTFNYNHGAVDANGDSLVYSFITPRDNAGVNVTFTAGHSATQPILSSPLMTLSSQFGDIVINPTTQEVGVMAVLVREYRNGVLIGSVIRDMQVWVRPCTNIYPSATGINGTSNFNIVTCAGNPVNFTINSGDVDPGDITTMYWNYGIAGATLNFSGVPYNIGTFSWTPTLADVSNIPYTFIVTVQDNHCPYHGSQTYSYSILVENITTTAGSTNVLCNGTSTGTAVVTPAGGGAPYTYSWSPGGATTQSVNGLAAGNYTVHVTDVNGCSDNATAVVLAPPLLVTGIPASSDVSCYGGNDGSATASVSGGTSPYVYSWSPSGGSAAVATGLIAGNYTVTVTDAHNCTRTATIAIAQPPVFSANIPVHADVSCFGGSNGSAAVNISGGTGPYTYSWSPSGGTNSSASGLDAGNYSISVVDANGCPASANISIVQPTDLNPSTGTTSAICNAANGAANCSVTGGTPPYSYLWSPGGVTTTSISGIIAGAYTVTITDGHGCSTSITAGVNNIGAPTASLSSLSPVTCYGGNNGSASISVSGGTPPLNYLWSPSGGTTTTASGLSAGNYTLTILDGNNCSTSVPVVVAEPDQLQINTAFTSPVCYGDNNGSASVSVIGGTGSYNYVWSPGGYVTSSVSNLAAGNYTITVTDANNCSQTSPLTIVQPAALTATIISQTDVSCFGNNNGSATVDPSGGTAPYDYVWLPSGGAAAAAAGLAAGNYTVTITDANNCIQSTPVIIVQPPVLSGVPLVTDVPCFGGTNGSASIGVTGGTTPYNYSWSSGVTSSSASGLAAGSYSVVVSDAHNCTLSSSVLLSEPTVLISSIPVSTGVSCFGGSNGTATATASGGTGPYTYLWSPTGGTSSSASGLVSGNYSVAITDAHNCVDVSNVFIPQPTVLNPSILASTNVSCFGGNNGSAVADVNGGTGPYAYVWSPSGGTIDTALSLTAGNYSVAITDALGCTTSIPVAIIQPTLLDATTNTISATCNYSNGSATSIVNGGTPPYNYLWTPGGSTSTSISGVAAGAYSVTVTDGNGCSSVVNAPVSNIGAPTANVTGVIDVSCFGGSDGSTTVSISGGTPPFTYAWSPTGGTALSASGLSSGNYTLLIADGNNCITAVSSTINQPALLTAAVPVSTPVSCYGGNNGSTMAVASGGTGPYTYAWSPAGGIDSSATGLAAGNYSISVTDAHGCTTSVNTAVAQPDSMDLSATSIPVTCFGTSTGYAYIVVGSGGTSPFTYNWLPAGGTNSSAANLPAGNYSVTVNDNNGCIQSQNVVVDQPTQVVSSATGTNILCYGDLNGSVSASASGGIPPYTYLWNPIGVHESSAINLGAGMYSVIVTDQNGCNDSTTASVNQPTQINLVTAGATTICIGQSATVSASASGGTGTYSYQWDNGITASSQNVSPVVTTSYGVIVSDINGCSLPPQSVTITVNPALISQAIGANPICAGDTTTISSTANGGNGGPYLYHWNTGSNNQSIQVSPTITTTYTVTVNDNCGTPNSNASTTVVVNPLPVVNFIPNPLTGCEPLVAQFFDGSNTSAGSNYFWDLGDGSFSTQQNPSHLYPHPGSYSVSLSVKSHEGCKNSILIPDAVVVYPLPVALFTPEPEVASIFNPKITFTDNSSGAYLWEWDLGDNSGTYNMQNIVHTYPDTGAYNVRLITTTDKGCKDTTFGRVMIEGEFAIYIPNAFTPDGNGTNDKFIPVGIGIKNFDMYIFNRWGANIFHSSSLGEPWNGRVQGSDEICQIDVYVYKIYVRDIKEKMHEYIGHVSLIK